MSLNGQWALTGDDGKEPIQATVPGQVHVDLLATGRIEDPYYRANELDVQWAGETDTQIPVQLH